MLKQHSIQTVSRSVRNTIAKHQHETEGGLCSYIFWGDEDEDDENQNYHHVTFF